MLWCRYVSELEILPAECLSMHNDDLLKFIKLNLGLKLFHFLSLSLVFSVSLE